MEKRYTFIVVLFLLSFTHSQLVHSQNTYKWEVGEVGVVDVSIKKDVLKKYYKGVEIEFTAGFYSVDKNDNWHTVLFSAEFYKEGEQIAMIKTPTVSETISNRAKSKWSSGFDEEIFIPYTYFDLANGTHPVEMVLKGDVDGEIVEFARKAFTLNLDNKKKRKYAEQKLTLKNINLDFNAQEFRTSYKGIEVNFDCDFLYGFDELFNTELSKEYAEYYLSAVLKDEDGNVIYPLDFSEEKRKKIVPEYDIYGNKKPVYKNIDLFIPYKNINKEGAFLAKLEITASNKDKSVVFPSLFSRDIEILKPITYNYDEQKFSIKNILAKDNTAVWGQKGISIEAQCFFKFASDQIRGIDSNESLKKYHFYLTINSQANKDIYSPALMKRVSKNNEPWGCYQVLEAASPKKATDLSFKIPYRMLNLQEGTHQIKVSIHATNKERTMDFGILSSFDMEVDYPKATVNHLWVEGLEAAPGTYDVAGKNIPLVNIFVGKKSKAGKGYPDVMWKIYIGSEAVFRSATNNNSFIGVDDSYSFKSMLADPVSFNAYDRDITSRHDLLGKINVNNGIEFGRRRINDTSFNKVEHVTLDYIKKQIPKFDFKTHEISPFKLNGISGIKSIVSYQIAGLHNKDELLVKPVLSNMHFNDEDMKFQFIEKSKTVDGPMFAINSNNSKGNFEIFVPLYQIGKFSKLSTDFIYEPYNLIVYSLADFIPPALKKVNDTKTKVSLVEHHQNDDFMGIKIKVDSKVPAAYYNNPEKLPIYHNFGIYLDANNEMLDDKIEEVTAYETIKNDIMLNKYIADEASFSRSFFIPYYKLAPLKGKQRINFEANSSIAKYDFEIGNLSKGLDFTMPKLYALQVQKYEVKIKKPRKYKYLHWEVYHGDLLLNKTTPKESDKKIMEWELVPTKVICHSQDKIHLYLLGTDRKGKESIITIWHFNGGDFYRGQTVTKLGRNSKIKSGQIEFFIE